ncbi:MAG TPA: hypothetical protein VFR20_02800 [Burkholderiaceae bacterium]|nr:hypothetical protein [Burkholderiaceae bacterium]
MPHLIQRFLRPVLHASLAAAFLTLAGCAQQRAPGYYAVQHDNTYSDAQQQGQGTAQSKAPSQLQLGFGSQNQKANDNPAGNTESAVQTREWEATRPLREPKTFLGTVPCLTSPGACAATRVTLTLAPSGEWRARSTPLGGNGSNTGGAVAQQGCWHVIGTAPLKILLQLNNLNPKATLTFINDNVLRIDSFNGVTPNLEYRLTRQADIDGIDELHGKPVLDCKTK